MNRSRKLTRILSFIVAVLFFACSGDNGQNAPTSGTIQGTVTQADTGNPIPGVTVTAKDSGGTTIATATTDSNGQYELTLPIGTVLICFDEANCTSTGDMMVGVLGGKTVTLNVAMSESASGGPIVSLAADAGDDFGYGATVALTASGNDPNGDTLSYTWSNATSGVPRLGTVTGSGTTGTVTFPTLADAFGPRTGSGGSDISGYAIPDRFEVLPIFPDTRGTVSARVTVSAGGKTASATLSLNAAGILPGIPNVATGMRIYMNRGNDDATQTWTLTRPADSAATLDDPTSRTPSFVADVAGSYTLSAGGKSIDLHVGNWQGVIAGLSGTDGFTVQPIYLFCHNGGSTYPYAPDRFTPWKQTNHATLYIRNITIPEDQGGDPEGKNCQYCHTVGYDVGVNNGGFDDAVDAYDPDWVPPAPYPDAWADLFANPGTAAIAKLANIQCENCHGPQSTPAHTRSDKTLDTLFGSPRISFSSEVCATCHGRTSHNYYSQWAVPAVTGATGHSNRGPRGIEGDQHELHPVPHGAGIRKVSGKTGRRKHLARRRGHRGPDREQRGAGHLHRVPRPA